MTEKVDGVTTSALIDTGAAVSVICESFQHQLSNISTPPVVNAFRTASGVLFPTIGSCKAWIAVNDLMFLLYWL